MRCMNRNKQTFYYALYSSRTPITDEYGNDTGESTITYSNPVLSKGNISPAQGRADVRQFGTDVKYDKVIVMDTLTTPINENTVLWVDTLPTLTDEGTTTTPWDYVVKSVARSLNSVSIAISKVIVQ